MEQNQSKTLIAVVSVAILVVVIGAIWYMTRGRSGNDLDFPNATTTFNDRSGASAPTAKNDNITVFLPRMNERVGTPLVVQGEARVFENTVNYRLRDARGVELAVGFTTADSPDIGQFGTFRGELNYVSETNQAGTVEIFWLSPQDGSEIDKIVIPVVITTTPEFIKG